MKVIKFILDPQIKSSIGAQDYQGLQAFIVNSVEDAEGRIKLLEKSEIMQNGGMLILDAMAIQTMHINELGSLLAKAEKKGLQIKTIINEQDRQLGAVMNLLKSSGVLLNSNEIEGIYKA